MGAVRHESVPAIKVYNGMRASTPLGRILFLRPFRVDWWQFIGFLEAGRVAESYDFSELMQDWKVDAGIAVRVFIAGTVVRLDLAVSEESGSFWLMLGHPF